jgi:hypothetical protein
VPLPDRALGELACQLISRLHFCVTVQAYYLPVLQHLAGVLPNHLTTPLVVMLLCTGEFRPPRHRASSVRIDSQDIAQRVRHTSVVLSVESCSGLGHHRLTTDRARVAHHMCTTVVARSARAPACRPGAAAGPAQRLWATAGRAAWAL